MRAASTYRAERREDAKMIAKFNGVHLSTIWHADKPARRVDPKLGTSKYMPHIGAKERARFPALRARAQDAA